MQLLRVSSVTTTDLHALDEFGRQIFWTTIRHALEGHDGTTKAKMSCLREPIELPKERRDMIIFMYTAHNTADKVLNKSILIFPRTFYIPPVNDGLWHHLGLLWSNQNYCIFLDGILIYSGNDLGAPTPLKGRGFFAIGQKMNSAGGNFVESLSFGGKLSQMNMWDKFLEAELVKASSTNCLNDVGTIIDWSKAVSLKSGLTAAIAPSECKSLRNGKQ